MISDDETPEETARRHKARDYSEGYLTLSSEQLEWQRKFQARLREKEVPEDIIKERADADGAEIQIDLDPVEAADAELASYWEAP
jgi:hypothetical protein